MYSRELEGKTCHCEYISNHAVKLYHNTSMKSPKLSGNKYVFESTTMKYTD